MDDNRDTNEVEQIVAGVLATKKYRAVCADTVRRIAAEEWARHRSSRRALKEASRATRSRLHQAYAAYESGIDYDRAYDDLHAAYAGGAPADIRAACARVMALHASTRERLPILERLYEEVFGRIGAPGVLLDLACGLNPLSLPWMGLQRGAAYTAYDIDRERVAFLSRYLSLPGVAGVAATAGVAGVPGVGGRALVQDVLCSPPAERGDVALLMKSSACLERQRPGATLALLDALHVRHVVVTFPVHSLGRRKRGMPEHYERTFLDMLSGRPWPVAQLRFETELVFLVDKG
jgi:16S rRNA (guanine(1405)-N(7))-methyltransferase